MKAHLVIKLQSFDDMLKRKGVSLTERKEDWCVIFWWSMEEDDCTLQMLLSNNKVKQHKIYQNILFFFFAHISYWHHFRSYYKKVGQVFYTLNTIISCDLKRLHFTFTLLLLWKVTKIVKNLIKYELLLQFHLYMW